MIAALACGLLMAPVVGATLVLHLSGAEVDSELMGEWSTETSRTLSRLPLVFALAIFGFIQLMIADKVFTKAEANELMSLIEIAGFQFGAWDGIILFMFCYAAFPASVKGLSILTQYARHGEIYLTEEWGEADA